MQELKADLKAKEGGVSVRPKITTIAGGLTRPSTKLGTAKTALAKAREKAEDKWAVAQTAKAGGGGGPGAKRTGGAAAAGKGGPSKGGVQKKQR